MSSPDRPSARDRAAETPRERAITVIAAELVECFPASIAGGEHRHVANAALNALAEHPEVLSALAGVPHPGVEALAEVIDPPAFDPRRLDVGTAYERGRRQRAALDAAGRVRALLGHTTTDTAQEARDA